MSEEAKWTDLTELLESLRGKDSLKLLLEVEQQCDPVEAFIDGLKDEALRGECRKTIRMRKELESNITRAFAATTPEEALRYAHAVARDVETTILRWATLRAAVVRWQSFRATQFTVRVTPE